MSDTPWECPDCGGGSGAHHANCRQHQRTFGQGPIMSTVGQQVIEERAKIRGDFREQARVSQELKQFMREIPTKNWDNMPASHREALDHIQEKIARILTGDPNEADAWLDLIGYPTLIHNILTKGKPI